MIKDRGTIKWTSLMLPEHVEQLKNLWKEDLKEERIILDQQMMEKFEKKILNAYMNQKSICVKYYVQNDIKKIQAKITHINEHKKEITFHTGQILAIKDVLLIS